MSFITTARASVLIPNFPSADNSVMADLISAACDFAEKFCQRTFTLTTYDEVQDGLGSELLFVDNFPVVSITRIATTPVPVLQVLNTNTTNSRATVRLAGDTSSPPVPQYLYLTTVLNGVTTNRTITLSTTLTLSALATAINAYSADGWSAAALGNAADWATADLRPPQGGYDCVRSGAVYLQMHGWPIGDFDFNPNTGEIVSPFGFFRGYRNYRIIYQAGWALDGSGNLSLTPIAQAVAELAAAMYNSRGLNSNLVSESLGSASYTQLAEKTFRSLSPLAAQAFYAYKSYRAPKFKVF
jgi:hypothetical protein